MPRSREQGWAPGRRKYEPASLRALAAEEQKKGGRGWHKRIRALTGCSIGTLNRALNGNDLRKSKSLSSIGPTGNGLSLKGKRAGTFLGSDHSAIVGAAPLFPRAIRAADSERLLKPGENSGKLGGKIIKGAWAGFPIFSLTLAERATCPRSCLRWNDCYGNNMPFARRFAHGPLLESLLPAEVALLALKHPGGFAVRLHQLGDFYSADYVRLWAALLDQFEPLHIFGYTARIDPACPIAKEISRLVDAWWPCEGIARFAIRQSDGAGQQPATFSRRFGAAAPEGAIQCPAQTGAAESCATCALCWGSRRTIAFVDH